MFLAIFQDSVPETFVGGFLKICKFYFFFILKLKINNLEVEIKRVQTWKYLLVVVHNDDVRV